MCTTYTNIMSFYIKDSDHLQILVSSAVLELDPSWILRRTLHQFNRQNNLIRFPSCRLGKRGYLSKTTQLQMQSRHWNLRVLCFTMTPFISSNINPFKWTNHQENGKDGNHWLVQNQDKYWREWLLGVCEAVILNFQLFYFSVGISLVNLVPGKWL